MNIRLSVHDILQILDKEIAWCLDHKDLERPGNSGEYNRGFISGLAQAKFIIIEFEQALKREPEGQR